MTRLRVTVLDLVSKGPMRKLYSRVMTPNIASIMPQVVAVWCEQLGHDVRFLCYTGREDLSQELVGETDVLILGAFTRSAHLAYAVSNLFRSRGAVTVLGGPHARCQEQPDGGAVHRPASVRVGYLPQEVETVERGSVLEVVLAGYEELATLEREIEVVSGRLAQLAPGNVALSVLQSDSLAAAVRPCWNRPIRSSRESATPRRERRFRMSFRRRPKRSRAS